MLPTTHTHWTLTPVISTQHSLHVQMLIGNLARELWLMVALGFGLDWYTAMLRCTRRYWQWEWRSQTGARGLPPRPPPTLLPPPQARLVHWTNYCTAKVITARGSNSWIKWFRTRSQNEAFRSDREDELAFLLLTRFSLRLATMRYNYSSTISGLTLVK